MHCTIQYNSRLLKVWGSAGVFKSKKKLVKTKGITRWHYVTPMDANFWNWESVGEHDVGRQLLNSDLWWWQLYGSSVNCVRLKFIKDSRNVEDCLNEDKSLTITTILVWNSSGTCERRDHWVRTLKKSKNQLWEGKQSQKGHSQKKSENQVRGWVK